MGAERPELLVDQKFFGTGVFLRFSPSDKGNENSSSVDQEEWKMYKGG